MQYPEVDLPYKEWKVSQNYIGLKEVGKEERKLQIDETITETSFFIVDWKTCYSCYSSVGPEIMFYHFWLSLFMIFETFTVGSLYTESRYNVNLGCKVFSAVDRIIRSQLFAL